ARRWAAASRVFRGLCPLLCNYARGCAGARPRLERDAGVGDRRTSASEGLGIGCRARIAEPGTGVHLLAAVLTGAERDSPVGLPGPVCTAGAVNRADSSQSRSACPQVEHTTSKAMPTACHALPRTTAGLIPGTTAGIAGARGAGPGHPGCFADCAPCCATMPAVVRGQAGLRRCGGQA